jgi:radical SAM protein with 4Fe4S-binding SPASM domain
LDLAGFARFGIRVQADEIYIKAMDDVTDPNLSSLVPDRSHRREFDEQMNEARGSLHSEGISFRIQSDADHYFGRFDTTQLYQKIPCYYGWLSTRLYPDGEVYPCCRGNVSLGNFNESQFRDIWNGERYRRFRVEGRSLPTNKSLVTGCDCQHCIHYQANLRMHRFLHPWTRWSLNDGTAGALVLKNGGSR